MGAVAEPFLEEPGDGFEIAVFAAIKPPADVCGLLSSTLGDVNSRLRRSYWGIV